jgi:disulfide bond formation protein DsbB
MLLAAATLVAVVATSGSLYFSEVMGLVPCELCWFQRILMYPLVVVLGVATLEDRPRVDRTVRPLSTLGVLIAAYHTYIQFTNEPSVCAVGGCGTIQYELFGLFTIPNLSLAAFVLITVAMVATRYDR